jgi:hypothetical protein
MVPKQNHKCTTHWFFVSSIPVPDLRYVAPLLLVSVQLCPTPPLTCESVRSRFPGAISLVLIGSNKWKLCDPASPHSHGLILGSSLK